MWFGECTVSSTSCGSAEQHRPVRAGWVLCSTESMGGGGRNATTQPGAREEGRKNQSEGDKLFPSQKAWAKLCSDAHWCKKNPKEVGKWQAKLPSLPLLHLVQDRRKSGGCHCNHPKRRMSVWSSPLCLVFVGDGSCCSLILHTNHAYSANSLNASWRQAKLL